MTLIRQILTIVAAVCIVATSIVVVHLVNAQPWWITLSAQIVLALTGVIWLVAQPYVRRWLAFVTLEQWRAIDVETDRTTPDRLDPHVRVVIVMVTTAISLTIQEYVGGADHYEKWFPYDGSEYWELASFVWWSGWRVIGYVVIPALVIACMPGERIRDYHLSARGFFRHLWIYVVMFLAFSPIVMLASMSPSFRETYPFYRMANRSQFDLWSWEALYIVQFLSLEFFFRGFLLQGLRRVIGSNAVFVMIVPYCMIHYGKPLPETLGAIFAGLILGTLAMRTRSIWGGVLIHCGVAITMDVLALRGCPPMGSERFCHT
ncbi:MAG TPA: type II CAAX endopeptidase family protein [Kofleriaceae bacterium]|nr:type II CAAX endopeptidase family protein [Kofleriaceae bacterium]